MVREPFAKDSKRRYMEKKSVEESSTTSLTFTSQQSARVSIVHSNFLRTFSERANGKEEGREHLARGETQRYFTFRATWPDSTRVCLKARGHVKRRHVGACRSNGELESIRRAEKKGWPGVAGSKKLSTKEGQRDQQSRLAIGHEQRIGREVWLRRFIRWRCKGDGQGVIECKAHTYAASSPEKSIPTQKHSWRRVHSVHWLSLSLSLPPTIETSSARERKRGGGWLPLPIGPPSYDTQRLNAYKRTRKRYYSPPPHEWHFWTFVRFEWIVCTCKSVFRTVHATLCQRLSFLFDFVWQFSCWSRALVYYCLPSRVELLDRSWTPLESFAGGVGSFLFRFSVCLWSNWDFSFCRKSLESTRENLKIRKDYRHFFFFFFFNITLLFHRRELKTKDLFVESLQKVGWWILFARQVAKWNSKTGYKKQGRQYDILAR